MCVIARQQKAAEPKIKTFPKEESPTAQADWACRALRFLFPSYDERVVNNASICDISQCLAVLGDNARFETLFREFDDKFFAPCHDTFTSSNDKNKVSSIILCFLVEQCGFRNVPGITFFGGTGNAFIPVVQAGMAFKDGLSVVHGEYTHMLQWCVIGWAQKTEAIKLSCPVVDIYRSLVGSSAFSKRKLAREFAKKNSDANDTKEVSMWEVVCDCFVPTVHQPLENVLDNLFSPTYRSPAYLTKSLLGEALQWTRVGECMRGRYDRRPAYQPALKGGRVQDITDRTLAKAVDTNRTIDKDGQVAYIPGLVGRDKQGNFLTPAAARKTEIATQPSVHPDKWKDWKARLGTKPEPK
jgi:hypothetical protein